MDEKRPELYVLQMEGRTRYDFIDKGEFSTYEKCYDAADKIAASPDYKDEDFIIFEPATGFRQRLSAHLFQQEQCPECNKIVSHHKMCRTYDCHGIPFRFVCHACYEKIMLRKGYDGEYYTEADECIDSDY